MSTVVTAGTTFCVFFSISNCSLGLTGLPSGLNVYLLERGESIFS